MKKPFHPKYLPVNLPLESLLEIMKIETNARVSSKGLKSYMRRC
ncbi:MAG: hypothetical protein AB7V16_10385 [Vulcanibacillus sp.]